MRALGWHVTCRVHERPAIKAGAAGSPCLKAGTSHCERAGSLGGDFTNCIDFAQDPAKIIRPNTLGQSQTQSKCLIGGGDSQPHHSSPPLSTTHTGEQTPPGGAHLPPEPAGTFY